MKSLLRNRRFFVAAAAVTLSSLTSCNRGMGCPTNFSVNEIWESGVSTLFGLLF